GGFSECSGLEMTLQIEEYKEGGRNSAALRFPTRIAWTNIVLKRGLTRTTALWDWHTDFVRGRGKRRDGIIALLTEDRQPHTVWQFRRGIPVKYSGPTFSAVQSSAAI